MDYQILINELLTKMTQTELADALGCSQPRVNRLKHGEVKIDDTGDKIKELAKIYKIKIKP